MITIPTRKLDKEMDSCTEMGNDLAINGSAKPKWSLAALPGIPAMFTRYV